MYTLLRILPTSQLVRTQLPTIAAALGIAEVFYKFHSFLLETAAFLVTWFVLDYLVSKVGTLVASRRREEGIGDRYTQEGQIE